MEVDGIDGDDADEDDDEGDGEELLEGIGAHGRCLQMAANLAAFSSRGPTFDSRFKPDIVAPGQDVISACAGVSPAAQPGAAANAAGAANHCDMGPAPSTDCAQTTMSGTSMSTPLVAGAVE